MKWLSILALIGFGLNTFAGEEHMMPVKVSPEFEKMKALLGTWEGKGKMHGKDEAIKVSYELTSGGTAIVEKIMPGTPHEMMTVYANRGNEVVATHYCMSGNQPEYKLKKATGNTFAFEMDGTRGLSNKDEMHMHGVTLTVDNTHLKQDWMNYNKGKKGEGAVFELTKVN